MLDGSAALSCRFVLLFILFYGEHLVFFAFVSASVHILEHFEYKISLHRHSQVPLVFTDDKMEH
jgi:hypothetical protein